MPLEEYRAKRNFEKTPEPAGGAAPATRHGKRAFSVQKHLASHLHYDLRLEHDGILLSWAVPKGPSLDPRERRLAMHVEDHPLEYGEFEGVIPEGYGAGIVLLWDQGEWIPEVDDVDRALDKGDLKFRLDGYKLKGSWVLVRTRGAGDRGWLLIKHRDEWSADTRELDITTFAPLSVKSNGDFADILAAGNPSIWVSNRPARGGQTGAMFERIVQRALSLRGHPEEPEPPRRKRADAAGSGVPMRTGKQASRTAANRGTTGTRNAATGQKPAAGRTTASTRKAASGRDPAAKRKTASKEGSPGAHPSSRRASTPHKA